MNHAMAGLGSQGADAAAVGLRLKWLRLAYLGYDNQRAFCRIVGFNNPPTWNNYESGRNLIEREEAIRVANVTGYGLDYIYRGVLDGLNPEKVSRLRDAEAGLITGKRPQTSEPQQNKRA